MTMKITTLAVALTAMLTIPAYAHDAFEDDLGGTAGTTDIILFKCSASESDIDRAQASVRDVNPPNATPNLSVQIAHATSTTTCPASGGAGWTAAQTTTGEGTWSPFTDLTGVSQTSPQNYYCVKVTKTDTPSEKYRLDHHCYHYGRLATHQASSLISIIQDQ